MTNSNADWPRPARNCGTALSIHAKPIGTTTAPGCRWPRRGAAARGFNRCSSTNNNCARFASSAGCWRPPTNSPSTATRIASAISSVKDTPIGPLSAKDTRPTPHLVAQTQEVLDAFLLDSKWHRRQQEIVRRLDRDGEVFLRFFVDSAGETTVRFAEPDQVATPPDFVGDPAASFGILTDIDDVETVLAYFVDGRRVAATDIQHRKANVDANVKRGLPLFFPVPQESAPRRQTVEKHERRGRNPIGDRIDPQTSRQHEKQRSTVCRCPDRLDGHPGGQRTHDQFSAVRAGDDSRCSQWHRLRLSGLGFGRRYLRHDSAGRTARHRQSAGHAGIHAHLRRVERATMPRRWWPKDRRCAISPGYRPIWSPTIRK